MLHAVTAQTVRRQDRSYRIFIVMELELAKYKSYARHVITRLIFAGIWPESNKTIKTILYFISFTSTLTVSVTSINFGIQNANNVILLTKGIGLASAFSSVFSKALLLPLHQEDIIFLKNRLTTKFMSDMETIEYRADLLSSVHVFSAFFNMHEAMVAFAMFMYCFVPLYVLFKHGTYLRTYPCLYPFSYTPGGLVHWLIYALEVAGAISVWTITVGADCGFLMYALELCGEFKILARKFTELKAGDGYKRNLKECIERHHLIIEAKNRLEDSYGLIVIWLALSGAFLLCSLIFQITELYDNHGSYVRIAHLCSHLVAKNLQIFMYAWYGNLIADESKAFLNAMYDSHWPEACDKNFKNDILIVLTQEPLVVVAKGCMYVQLDMFTKIVKTSMSYFFLIQTLAN
ncbi:odorant receptor 247 isoform X1 [Nasonia vitripennis]|uniref:Odorant receptor n=2 Tax=Nasonia vitripennis TaxID=7425 RepID=A0A7M7M884_NASVI|nr:odorant receptor 247 isoform X1 [Nasonia vitripennis]